MYDLRYSVLCLHAYEKDVACLCISVLSVLTQHDRIFTSSICAGASNVIFGTMMVDALVCAIYVCACGKNFLGMHGVWTHKWNAKSNVMCSGMSFVPAIICVVYMQSDVYVCGFYSLVCVVCSDMENPHPCLRQHLFKVAWINIRCSCSSFPKQTHPAEIMRYYCTISCNKL